MRFTFFLCLTCTTLLLLIYWTDRKVSYSKILFFKTLTLRLELEDFHWRWSAEKKNIKKIIRVVKLV